MTFPELCASRGLHTDIEVARATCDRIFRTTVYQIRVGRTRDLRWSTIEPLADALGVTAYGLMSAIQCTPAKKKKKAA